MKRITTANLLYSLAGILFLASLYTTKETLLPIRQEGLRILVFIMATVTILKIIDFIRFLVRELGERNANFVHRFTALTTFTVFLIIGLGKGVDQPELQKVILTVRYATEPALAGLICIAMLFGLFNSARAQTSLFANVFRVSALFFLILFSGALNRVALPEPIRAVFDFLSALPSGGIIGLLIGLAIGAIVSTVRVLFLGEVPPAYGVRAKPKKSAEPYTGKERI